MVDEEFFLRISSVYVKKQWILIKTDLWRYFKIDRTWHKISTIDFIVRKFAFISVINHGFELIEISREIIPKAS